MPGWMGPLRPTRRKPAGSPARAPGAWKPVALRYFLEKARGRKLPQKAAASHLRDT